jgi:hypothetical protein
MVLRRGKTMTGNLNQEPAEWLKEQFEFEYCAECDGDAEHHTAIPFMGNWFARCNCPRDDNGNLHPTIELFRAEAA